MSCMPEEYIKSLMEKVTAANFSLQTYSYTLEKFETIGQNYFGIIVPVILSGKSNGKDVKIEIVLKLAPLDERYRVSGAVTAMFAREIFVYDVLFKTYAKMQENFSEHLKYIMPQCYYLQKEYCKEAIIMQNMHGEGYRPYSPMFLDLDHITVALKELAKLHGLSFIVEYKVPDSYKKKSDICVPLTEESGKRYMDVMKDRLNRAIKNFEATEYILLLQRLHINCAEFFKMVVTHVQKTCICHGDIWKENILFKYYRETIPTSACLIDYQNTRVSCSAYDTLYLIISSTNTELRRQYYYQLLEIYYDTFQEILKEGGLDSDEVYSKQMFDYDLKIVAPACIITANCAFWLSSGLQEVGHVRSKVFWSTQEEKNQAMCKYVQIVKSMIDDCCSYGYMSLHCDDHAPKTD